MARNVAVSKAALARARERRRQLDRDRDERDERIAMSAAQTMMALESLTEAEQARDAAAAMVGQTLRSLLREGLTHERAAALLEVGVADVRRLSRVAATERPPSEPKPGVSTENRARGRATAAIGPDGGDVRGSG